MSMRLFALMMVQRITVYQYLINIVKKILILRLYIKKTEVSAARVIQDLKMPGANIFGLLMVMIIFPKIV